MKKYVKMVEAIKYEPGNIEQIKELFNKVNIEPNSNPMVIIDPVTGRWRVQPGDYIVKDFKGILVYKASRFEEEFEKLYIQDELDIIDTQKIGEIKTHESGTEEQVKQAEKELDKLTESKGVSDESQKALKDEVADKAPKTKKAAEKK